ncbi:MAG: polysaccharide biosynthesis C-terminal domain-containing protein [Planctomycetes bacterium]|nr:polysaccharide biosynthesis C-terminal domain-containing protein [Planctomycetota bacterium]
MTLQQKTESGHGRFDARVLAGTGLQAAARLATALLALITVALLARTLEKDAFGRYSATIALFQVLDVLVDCGSLQAAVRFVAKNSACARSAVRSAVRFRIFTAGISVVIATLLAIILKDPQVGFITLAALAFFTHAAGVGVAVLHADIDYKQSESLRIAGSLMGLLATVLLVGLGARDAGSMLIAIYAGASVSNLLLAFSVKSNIPAGEVPVRGSTFWRESVSLGMGGVVRQAYYSANPVLARALGGDIAGARFAPAYRLTGFSILFSVYFGSSALPALVRLFHTDRDAWTRFVRRWTLVLITTGAAIGGGMFIFRERILILLFGEEYADSASVLAPMCITTVVIYLGGFALTQLIAQGRDRAALWISVAGLVVNIITNILLTPRMGAEGAAWASVTTETAVAAGALGFLWMIRGIEPSTSNSAANMLTK